MTFTVIALVCVAGMSPADCGPEPNHSRDMAIVATTATEMECTRRAMLDPAKSAIFRNLAEGEFIKTMCVRR